MGGSVAPVDDAVLRTLTQRAQTHALIERVTTERTAGTVSMIRAECEPDRYPDHVQAARLEIRWYTNGDYNFHYIETHTDSVWQCRWDRHPNPHTERAHFHPPPDAESEEAVPDSPPDQHPSALFTRTLANIQQRLDSLWKNIDD